MAKKVTSDVYTLSAVLKGIDELKHARRIALKKNPNFTALDGHIESLEEWASLWASEAGTEAENDPTVNACVKLLDSYKVEHRPYA